MLAYLDTLIAALSVRDAAEVERLLAHPLARILTDDARREASRFTVADGDPLADPLAAPLQVMQLRHQTAELLGEGPRVADREGFDEPVRSTISAVPLGRRQQQMELQLSA